jgi:hypothetical protein
VYHSFNPCWAVGGGGRRGQIRRQGWGQVNMKCGANHSSWQSTEEVTCPIDAPRAILWTGESLEGDWTRSGSAAAASPTARPASLRLCYPSMINAISLLRCETPRKNIQLGNLGQEEDQTVAPAVTAISGPLSDRRRHCWATSSDGTMANPPPNSALTAPAAAPSIPATYFMSPKPLTNWSWTHGSNRVLGSKCPGGIIQAPFPHPEQLLGVLWYSFGGVLSHCSFDLAGLQTVG